jgi:hypothetical protein
MAIVGGMVSPEATVTLSAADVPVFPVVSTAMA